MAAHLMTAGRDHVLPRYRVIVVVNDAQFLVKKDGEKKTVIQLTGNPPYDFTYRPVGNTMPLPPDSPVLDYRAGVSRAKVTQEHVDAGTYPLLVLGDFLPGVAVARVVIAADPETTTTTYSKAPCGTSTWAGNTPNLISWHGIGSMDAAGNDFREYFDTVNGRYYTTPLYEPTYFEGYAGHSAPEAPTHLGGDQFFVNPAAEGATKHGRNVVYRNGYPVATADWPILAACEVRDHDYATTGLVWLKILTGRWFVEPELFNPIESTPDYFFENHSLNGFYLFEEGPNGWDLITLDIPAVEVDAPTTSLILQAPLFDADGLFVAGLIETAYGLAIPAAYIYHASRLMNKTQARVLKIDVMSRLVTIADPASVVRDEQDFADSTLSVYNRWSWIQTLSVAPTSAGSVRKITKTATIVETKDRSDDDVGTAWLPFENVWPWHGTQSGAEAYATSFFNSNQGAIWSVAKDAFDVWAAAHGASPGDYPENSNISVHYAYASNTNTTYPSIPEGGSLSDTFGQYSGVSINIATGELSINLSAAADIMEGLQLPNSTYTKSQKTTTTTTSSLDVFGTGVGATTKEDTVTTAGWTLVSDGGGPAVRGDGFVQFDIPSTMFEGRIWLTNDLSFTIEARDAGTTTGATPAEYRVVASDPRASAAIVENRTTNALTYVGVRDGS